jgi:putative photosynthetic complex assembly protein
MTTREPKATKNGVPRGALIGAAGVIAVALVSAAMAQLTGFTASPEPESTRVESLALRFEDRPDGGIAVLSAKDDSVIEILPPQSNGFIRGALRGLVRQRKLQDMGSEAPFTLTRWADGRISLTDTATDERIYLDAFGRTNRNAFAELLVKGSESP